MNPQLLICIFAASILSVYSAGSKEKPPKRSDFAIPEDLTPVSEGRDGFSAEQSRRYRQAYEGDTLTTSGNAGNYAASRLSENLPTAIVHRYGPVSELESQPLPEIGEVRATTILGTMTLNEMMRDERSRFKAIAVVHKGKLVFEEYIGIRDWDNHLWASAKKILVGTLAHIASEENLVDLKAPI